MFVVHQWGDSEACVVAEWHAPAQHQDQAVADVTQPWGHKAPGGQLVTRTAWFSYGGDGEELF